MRLLARHVARELSISYWPGTIRPLWGVSLWPTAVLIFHLLGTRVQSSITERHLEISPSSQITLYKYKFIPFIFKNSLFTFRKLGFRGTPNRKKQFVNIRRHGRIKPQDCRVLIPWNVVKRHMHLLYVLLTAWNLILIHRLFGRSFIAGRTSRPVARSVTRKKALGRTRLSIEWTGLSWMSVWHNSSN